jgi:hypothetical protein
MTRITTSITSLRHAAHLDTRLPGRYRQLDVHHAVIRRRRELAADRTALAADVTQKRMPPLRSATVQA